MALPAALAELAAAAAPIVIPELIFGGLGLAESLIGRENINPTIGDILDTIDDVSLANSFFEAGGALPSGSYGSWIRPYARIGSWGLMGVVPGFPGEGLARIILSEYRPHEEQSGLMEAAKGAVNAVLGQFGGGGGGPGAPNMAANLPALAFGNAPQGVAGVAGVPTVSDLLAAATTKAILADAARVSSYADWLDTQKQMAELYADWYGNYPRMSRQALADAANLVL